MFARDGLYLRRGRGDCSSFTSAFSAFLIIEGTGQIMEELCSNCEHFTQISISPSTHIWGDCRKPASGLEQINGQREAVFKWADGTCTDFEPKQEAES